MSGKRQHFIPQFLQKGFASHTAGNEVFTWVYRKDSKPFNSNIKNVGVEGSFYTEDDDSSVDEMITLVESDFAQILDSVRSKEAVEKNDKEHLALLLAHLEVRTRYIRQIFLSTGNYIINEILDFLSDRTLCENFLRRKLQNDPSIIRDPFSEELRKSGLSQQALPFLVSLSKPLIELQIPNFASSLTKMIVHMKSQMPSVLKRSTKTGHLKALNRRLAPDLKIKRYEKLNFRVEVSENAPLLLGDSAVIFHISGDRRFKPFLEKTDDLFAVLLPISHRLVLIGSVEEKYVTDFKIIKRVTAGCSLEYFIANENILENQQLSSIISENAHLLTKSEIEKMLDNVINKSMFNKTNAADAKSRSGD